MKNKNELTYNSWRGMFDRCDNIKNIQYHRYGGRGIKITKRWYVYDNFVKDMGERPSKEFSIERINNDKGYSKKNCRWATRAEQCRNRRSNVLINVRGKKMCATDAEKHLGLPPTLITQRLKLGWTEEEAIGPIQKVHQYITFNNKTQSIAAWGRELGICGKTIKRRLLKGLSTEQVLKKEE